MEGDEPERGGRAGRALGRLVGSVVSPVVEQVDVDEIVQRIDVDEVVDRIDVDELVDRLDVNRLLDRIDPDRLLDRIDPDRLLDRVDPDRLLDRVDVNRLLDRVEPDQLLDRVDPDRLLERVDVNRLVERTQIQALIARSTTGVFTQVIDVARAQIIIADQVVQGVPGVVLRRRVRELPPSPTEEAVPVPPGRFTRTERAVAVQGRYGGSLSRFLAFLVDQFLIGTLFTIGTVLVALAVSILFRTDIQLDDDETRWPIVVAFLLWGFVYTAGSLATTGRTVGKALLGLTVVADAGGRVDGRRAAIRTLAFPLSFALLGIGFLLGLVRRDRRELHDLIAGTGVIYEWDAEVARLRDE